MTVHNQNSYQNIHRYNFRREKQTVHFAKEKRKLKITMIIKSSRKLMMLT